MTERIQVTDVVFEAPPLDASEFAVVAQVEGLRSAMQRQLHEPRRWFGSLRRLSLALAVQGSNRIEGYHAALDDVAAAGDREAPLDADLETRLVLFGYQQAMTYVLQLSREERVDYSEHLIKSLHFMMTSFDLENRPGLWRSGSIFVTTERAGEVVYEGPDVDLVPQLMAELVDRLNTATDAPAMVRAGMAHLNLVMIHPFRDGNGRMARCLQTLILAREGVLAPEFCSIEEYLGANTPAYYEVLGRVGGGGWHPERDARSWVRFVLLAHLKQARLLQLRIRESETLWVDLAKLVEARDLPERTIPLLWDSAHRLRVRNSIYRKLLASSSGEEISEAAAGRDLRLCVERGLLLALGEKRGRVYAATPELGAVWDAIKARRPPAPNADRIFAAPN